MPHGKNGSAAATHPAVDAIHDPVDRDDHLLMGQVVISVYKTIL